MPPEIHNRYEYSDCLNINAALAINSGIRRARGQFILPGNIDLLYSSELMEYLASKHLDENKRYRIDRCDVDRNVAVYKTLEEQLEYCRNNIIKVQRHNPETKSRFRRKLPKLHTMACGDFQLLSKKWWHKLHGYSEADIISAYADTILSYASYAAGVREVVLKDPMRLYHIDHENTFNERKFESGFLGEKVLDLPVFPSKIRRKTKSLLRLFLFHTGYRFKSRIDGIPTLHYLECIRLCRDMIFGKHSYVMNDDNWGLGQESLKESIINTADWD